MAKREKIILVLGQAKDYLYGAFRDTEEGKKEAEKYMKRIKKRDKVKLYLKIK